MTTKITRLIEGSVRDALYARQQELRKKSGLPHPDYYKELGKSYDIQNDSERYARQSEIRKKYGIKEDAEISEAQDYKVEVTHKDKDGKEVSMVHHLRGVKQRNAAGYIAMDRHRDMLKKKGIEPHALSARIVEESQIDESAARFIQKVNQAVNAAASGKHKNAQMHLDNARTFMLGVKSTDMEKIKDAHAAYKNLRNKYAGTGGNYKIKDDMVGVAKVIHNEETQIAEGYAEEDIANGGTVIFKHNGKHVMSKVTHKTGGGAATKIHTTSKHVVPLHHVVSTDASDWSRFKDATVKEETQIDEISTELKTRYVTKAKEQIKQTQPFTKKGEYKDIAKNFIAKREKGIAKANEQTAEPATGMHKMLDKQKQVEATPMKPRGAQKTFAKIREEYPPKVEKSYYKGLKLHFARGNRGGKSSSSKGGPASDAGADAGGSGSGGNGQ